MYKVLIIEDDPMVAMINEQYINRNKHFHVNMVCNNGNDGLTYLKEHPIDLVILDVYMPIMNGLETLRKIRASELPVDIIMVTAANDSSTLESSMHLGIIDFLVKPFSYDRFQDSLTKYLAHMNAKSDSSNLNQKQIDYILESSHKNNSDIHPKGIQGKTLDTVISFLNQRKGIWLTSDEIADHLSLSRVTIRRYMSHLAEIGTVNEAMNYETGGRPCMMYTIN